MVRGKNVINSATHFLITTFSSLSQGDNKAIVTIGGFILSILNSRVGHENKTLGWASGSEVTPAIAMICPN